MNEFHNGLFDERQNNSPAAHPPVPVLGWFKPQVQVSPVSSAGGGGGVKQMLIAVHAVKYYDEGI